MKLVNDHYVVLLLLFLLLLLLFYSAVVVDWLGRIDSVFGIDCLTAVLLTVGGNSIEMLLKMPD